MPFKARCLRSILGIPRSFISRVRNETVLQEAGTEKLSIILWRRQLLLLGASRNFHGRMSCEHVFCMMGRFSRDGMMDFGSGVNPNKHGFQKLFAWLWICAAIGLVWRPYELHRPYHECCT